MQERQSAFLQTCILAVLLGAATIMLYWPVTRHDFVDYDDNGYVTQNAQVQGGLTLSGVRWAFTHPVGGNWHPLTVMSHMLDCEIFGLRAGGHHLVNLSLHALNSILVFLFLNLLTRARWRSFFVAAFFAWHPLHVESVAWVAERKDVLSGFFGLLALLAYVRYVRSSHAENSALAPPASGGARRLGGPFYYCLALIFFALGLLSKPMLVTWPFILLLLDYWPLGRLQAGSWRRVLIEKIPFLMLSAMDCIATVLVQKQVGAMESFSKLPLAFRVENALVSYCRYLFKTFWPADLAVFYPLPAHWSLWLALLAGAFLVSFTLLLWWRRARCPFGLVGWLWFVGTLVPVIGIIQVGMQAMADRYTYLPSIGLFLLLVWSVAEMPGPRRQWAGPWLAGAAALLLIVVARQQIAHWQNSETLFRHALEAAADNDVARVGLGSALLHKNKTDAAQAQFEAALRVNPKCAKAHEFLGHIAALQGDGDAAISHYKAVTSLKPDLADAHNNLGNLLGSQGHMDEAIVELQHAIRLAPTSAEAHGNLGNMLASKGEVVAAIEHFQTAIRLKPDMAGFHLGLASALTAKGQLSEAAGEFQEALRLQPENIQAHCEFARLLAKQGQLDGAIVQYQEAIRLQPDFVPARHGLGFLFAKLGRFDEAIAQLQEVVRLQPDQYDAHYHLGRAYLEKRDLDEAAGQFRSAVQLLPDFAPAHYYLGLVLAGKGQVDDAISELQECIRLKPDDAVARNKLGLILTQSGRLDEAIAQFQAALNLKPDYAEAGNNLTRARALKNGP